MAKSLLSKLVSSQRLTKLTRHKLALKTSYTKKLSYTRKVNAREVARFIPPWQEIYNQSQWESRRQWWHNDLSPRFTCLPASYVIVVAIHPLGGSCTNRHHTPNPQSGAAQPIQDGDPQATSNLLEYLLAIRQEKVKNPSQSPRLEPETSTFLRSMILAAPSHLGSGNHQEKQAKSTAKHNPQVPLDAIT